MSDTVDINIDSNYFDQELKDRFKIVSFIASGGGGIIYKVIERLSEKELVLKLIKQDLPGKAMERFEQEAKACSKISHPNVLGFSEYGITHSGIPFILMPYLNGLSLKQMLKEKKITKAETVLDIFRQICAGLKASHDAGIIHRDIKPENIIVEEVSDSYKCKIIDFGVAKMAPTGGEIQALTQTGEIFGTPAYMSPEQCNGSIIDARADIYAVGCMLYEAFVGNAPFRGENAFVTLTMHLNEQPPPLPESGSLDLIPEELESIIHKCLAKDPSNRFQSAQELADSLAKISTSSNPFASLKKLPGNRSVVYILSALVVVLIVASVLNQDQTQKSKGEQSPKDKVYVKSVNKLSRAIIALNKNKSQKAHNLSNTLITTIEKRLNLNESKARKSAPYEVLLREAIFIRGHALMKLKKFGLARNDFKRCMEMSPKDPTYRNALAQVNIELNQSANAGIVLKLVKPTLESFHKKLETPVGFVDNWNTPDIYRRIREANQKVIFEDIIRVKASDQSWNAVKGIKINPDNKLWIDCRDDGIWTTGMVAPGDNKSYWSDADGARFSTVYESPAQCLLGMIGSNHSFFVGKHSWNSIAPGTGTLRLICNDGVLPKGSMLENGFSVNNKDNFGFMTVRVIVTEPINKLRISGWAVPDLYRKIKRLKQKVVYSNVVTVDARNPHWTKLEGFLVTKKHRIWLDTRAGDQWDYAPVNEYGFTSNGQKARVGPEGDSQAFTHKFPLGSLVATIGSGRHKILVGQKKLNLKSPAKGTIKFICNDAAQSDEPIPIQGYIPDYSRDNRGFITVRVVITETL